jgi:hypothetical protein
MVPQGHAPVDRKFVEALADKIIPGAAVFEWQKQRIAREG